MTIETLHKLWGVEVSKRVLQALANGRWASQLLQSSQELGY
jgi:hypothetical protein